MLVSLISTLVFLSSIARAKDDDQPPAPAPDAEGQGQAPSPAPSPSIEDEEAAVLAAPATPPPRPPAARPPVVSRPRPVMQSTDAPAATPSPAAAEADTDTALVLELSTAGFVSGTLDGGIFVGGRTASGLIIGGALDYTSASVTQMPAGAPSATTSTRALRFGAGVRYAFLRTADRRVDLYAAGDIDVVFSNAEIPSGPTAPDLSATGFSLAAGPGLRFWIHEHLALGYLARFQLTHLSGPQGGLVNPPTNDVTPVSSNTLGFAGTFQLLGMF
jgi:hypothetical protein